MIKTAEVAAYFQRFDEAEKLYLDMDRWYVMFYVTSKNDKLTKRNKNI